MTRLGVVAIGRNEGARLERCLDSARGDQRVLVYVDSGSSDGSAAAAERRGAHVVRLDAATPFTAARARNAGFARLLEVAPEVAWVQFVDGDCEIVPSWWLALERWLPGPERAAVVCGRRRERAPEASLYNLLCDLEWDTPIGSAESCGGDAAMRVAALRAVGGFAPSLIAGEEPELCFRLRAAGWTIERIDAEMTLHDAALHTFAQWWRRALRSGHAYAENYALHGDSPERFKRRELRSILAWGGALPALGLAAALALGPVAWLAPAAAYGALYARVLRAKRRTGTAPHAARAYAASVVVGKLAQLAGVVGFHWNRARGRRTELIEYKRPA